MNALIAGMVPLLVFACTDVPEEDPLTLEQASEQVTFASTEALGPHRFLATQERVEYRWETEVSRHKEVVEIRWQDWDQFYYHRTVDERSTEEVLVFHGQCWVRRNGSWSVVNDAEPYRVQMRMSWNMWDQVINQFGDRYTLTEQGQEEIDGREARQFALSLGEPPVTATAGPRSGGRLDPTELVGTLWIDTATAVRLIGSFRGLLVRDGYKLEYALQLARTNIGAEQDITPPGLERE